jgi:hypothetical protein
MILPKTNAKPLVASIAKTPQAINAPINVPASLHKPLDKVPPLRKILVSLENKIVLEVLPCRTHDSNYLNNTI